MWSLSFVKVLVVKYYRFCPICIFFKLFMLLIPCMRAHRLSELSLEVSGLVFFFFLTDTPKGFSLKGLLPVRARRDKLAPVIDTLAKWGLIVILSAWSHCKGRLWTVSECFGGWWHRHQWQSKHRGGALKEKNVKKKAATGETTPHHELVNEETVRVLSMDWRGCQCYIRNIWVRGRWGMGEAVGSRNETQLGTADWYLQRWL